MQTLSANPVHTQWITLAPGFAGYLALPPAGRGPGLVLWQEIFGVNPHIRAVAEQYALDGFVVLAPDIFWRQKMSGARPPAWNWATWAPTAIAPWH